MKKILLTLMVPSIALALPCPEVKVQYNEYNYKRVYRAAELSKSLEIEQAIALSK